jgi:AhpD family alkylhydroperoxidase
MNNGQKDYPGLYEHLQWLIGNLGTEIPGTMGGFAAMHKNAVSAGELPARTKELVALGIAVAVRCDGCIAYHVHDAVQSGATKAEIAETIGVAVLMGGGPALMYGAEAFEALDQFVEVA